MFDAGRFSAMWLCLKRSGQFHNGAISEQRGAHFVASADARSLVFGSPEKPSTPNASTNVAVDTAVMARLQRGLLFTDAP